MESSTLHWFFSGINELAAKALYLAPRYNDADDVTECEAGELTGLEVYKCGASPIMRLPITE